MLRALEIAQTGIGRVEPNPAVGAVITDADLRLITEGAHPEFGGPHAEVVAIANANESLVDATLYVTLEPCSHHGKTPPCADAVIAAGIQRVVIATLDPAPHTSGAGIRKLEEAGIHVEIGLCEKQGQRLIAPFRKLMTKQQPYVHAKWAMTADGKIATKTGSSKWISGEQSRKIVHSLRGRMDGILTGIGTVLADDPQLTVRPPGVRIPTRIVLDSHAQISGNSKLVQTIKQAPLIVFVGEFAPAENLNRLKDLGVEIQVCAIDESTNRVDVLEVLRVLGERQMTNVLIEAGPQIMGALFDASTIDEVHCFLAPKLVGGVNAVTPMAGSGVAEMLNAIHLEDSETIIVDQDVYLHGWINHG